MIGASWQIIIWLMGILIAVSGVIAAFALITEMRI